VPEVYKRVNASSGSVGGNCSQRPNQEGIEDPAPVGVFNFLATSAVGLKHSEIERILIPPLAAKRGGSVAKLGGSVLSINNMNRSDEHTSDAAMNFATSR
jgi:hypothetical protein